jgi:hypothetical protein
MPSPRARTYRKGLANASSSGAVRGEEEIEEEEDSGNGNGNDGAVSHPVPRNRERSLHTCAQDVQITRMTTI